MIDAATVINCCICGSAAQYIEHTEVRGPRGIGWQECPAVYADRGYCALHFFVGQERRQEYEHRAIYATYNIYPRPDAGEEAGE